jgi:hypothetical protein
MKMLLVTRCTIRGLLAFARVCVWGMTRVLSVSKS